MAEPTVENYLQAYAIRESDTDNIDDPQARDAATKLLAEDLVDWAWRCIDPVKLNADVEGIFARDEDGALHLTLKGGK